MTAAVRRPGVLTAYRWLATAFAALVLVQAFLAGEGFFTGRGALLEVHALEGQILVLLALAGIVLVSLAGVHDRTPVPLLAAQVILFVLTAVQLMLGFGATEGHSRQSAALHLPNGVAIFGLAVATAVIAWRRRERPATAAAVNVGSSGDQGVQTAALVSRSQAR